jgi:integrase
MAYSGLDAAFRGMNIDGDRPELIVIDDPETKESAKSEMQIEDRKTMLDQDIDGLVGQDNRMGVVITSTVQNCYCLSAMITDPKTLPAYNGRRFGLIESWPTNAELWDEYIAERKLDTSTREGKRIQGCWDRFIEIAGDTLISESTLDHIHAGLDAFVEQKLTDGQAVSAIRRNLSEPLAALRRGSAVYRLGWVIEPARLPKYQSKGKRTLNYEQQRVLLDACRDWDDGIAACILLMLQAGAMPSEVKRLDFEQDVHLEGLPYVIFRGGDSGVTKTEARKRIAPVVLEAQLIARHLEETIQWLNSVTDSTPSATIKKRLKSVLGEGYTGHCLRHTLRSNCAAVSANPFAVASIAGWKTPGSGLSDIMLNYGKEGLQTSETLLNLQQESLKIHRHLLPQEASNVIPIRRV